MKSDENFNEETVKKSFECPQHGIPCEDQDCDTCLFNGQTTEEVNDFLESILVPDDV